MTEQIRLSFSAASDWRSCQQRYWYRYQERLRPIIESAAPTLGRVLHDFLAEYYGALQRQKVINGTTAYRKATKALRAKDEELQKLAWAARSGGAPDVAASLMGVLPHALDLAEAYHRVRGEDDSEQHQVLLVERRLEYPLWDGGPVVPCVVDLVTQDERGAVCLWEHKSTTQIPRQGRRFRDLQTTLYAAILSEVLDVQPTNVVWNYLGTKSLYQPEPLKSGELTQRQDIHTTYTLYLNAIKQAKLKEADYEETLDRIAEREYTDLFPRFELPLMQDEQVLLRDFVSTGSEIVRALDGEGFVPVRNISRDCDWCSFTPLCETAVLGTDSTRIRHKLFTQSKEKTHATKATVLEEASLTRFLEE